MASIIAPMAIISYPTNLNNLKQPTKPISLLSLKTLPRSLTTSNSSRNLNFSTSMAETAITSAIFATLSSCGPAFAAQKVAELAEGDNRGLALLLPLIPAIIWVLYNILQPALNQLNRMRNEKK